MLGHREAYVARQAAATHGPAPSRTPAKDSWFGLKAGVGTDSHLGQAFGLTLGGRYQWTEFGEEWVASASSMGSGLTSGSPTASSTS